MFQQGIHLQAPNANQQAFHVHLPFVLNSKGQRIGVDEGSG